MRSGAGRVGGLLALGFWLAVTVSWWALALWPAPDEPPAWLLRARTVCFNAGESGLPDASGWLVLIGQPIGLLAVMMVIWGDALRSGLRGLASGPAGRALLVSTAALLVVGVGAAGARVVSIAPVGRAGVSSPPDTYPRLDRQAPALELVDQHGERLSLETLQGRPALVTFAFGHCATVCPAVVRQVLEGRERAGLLEPPPVVVITLDPWRDTPRRLPSVAEHWQIRGEDRVLSGEIDDVNRVLDDWKVARERNPQTGNLLHPPLVYLLDAAGRIAYASTGAPEEVAELLRRVGPARS